MPHMRQGLTDWNRLNYCLQRNNIMCWSTASKSRCDEIRSIRQVELLFPTKTNLVQRPYLNNFDATVSPCQELTSWDNSSSKSIWLSRKESHCEDILPVSSTDGAVISPTISLALSLWYTWKCEIKENLSGVLLLHLKLRNTK